MSPDSAPIQPINEFREQVKKLEEKGETKAVWMTMTDEEVNNRKTQTIPLLAKVLGKTEEEVGTQLELSRNKLTIFGKSHEKVARGVSMVINNAIDIEKDKRNLKYQSLTADSGVRLGPDGNINAAEVIIMHLNSQLVGSEDKTGESYMMPLAAGIHEDVVKNAVNDARTALDLLGAVKLPAYHDALS